MHIADLRHDNESLQKKLEHIFQLRRTKSAINWDQSMFLDLLESFGNPQDHLPPVIHIAGTNGKGSTVAMLRSTLEASGKKVHAYTSPHLVNVNERIVLAGEYISNQRLEALIDEALSHINDAPLSFFEIMTAVAFRAFSETPADVLLLEVGMGGRLDCTNVVKKPLLSVINRISMDHTQFLGETIREIAAEKAGIIKGGVPCVIGFQGQDDNAEEISHVLRNAAQNQNTTLYQCGHEWAVREKKGRLEFEMAGQTKNYALPALVGQHQVLNAGLALACVALLSDELKIDDDAINRGLETASWPGRLQKLHDFWPHGADGHEIWLDAGHNDSAGEALSHQISRWNDDDQKPLHLIVGMLKMKSPKPYLAPLLYQVDHLHVVPIRSDPNTHTQETLLEFIDTNHFQKNKIHEHDSAVDAVSKILNEYKDCRIIISGSVYLAGEVLGFVQGAE